MKLRWSAPALLIMGSMVILIALTGVVQIVTSRLLDSAHESQYELMRQVLASILKSTEDRALVRAEVVASMPAVRSAFVAHDRPKLLAECQRMYQVQDEKYGLDQAQFHLPPGISFLRLHKPESFGDDQTSYRPMLSDVHQNKVLRKGTALTKAGPAVFGIVPIVDDGGQFIGSFEMGLEFAPMLDKMKEAYGLETAVFFDEKQLRDISTDLPGDVLQPKNRVGKYIRYHATHIELATGLVLDKDVDVTKPTHYERTVAGTLWGVQLVPIYNYANKQIGVVALASDFREDKTNARRTQIWVALAAMFGIVGMAGLILMVVRGVVIAPIASINERLAALADGDTSREAGTTDHTCEELRTIAEAYERLRDRAAAGAAAAATDDKKDGEGA